VRKVSSLSTLGEIDVLSPAECDEVAEAVLSERDRWTSRSPTGMFATLGVNAYMDLAPAADVDASYFGPVRGSNLVLRQRFDSLHGKLAEALETELGLPVRYADDLARPGFHIWVGLGIPSQPLASIHFDLQYQRLLARPEYAHASGTVSFTLPVRLPAAGSSLRVWPCHYPADRHRVPAIYPFVLFVAEGGLVAYGTDPKDLFRRAASYIDRILRGEKPANLPVQAPVKFELGVNLKTAKALGLTVPPTLLARADEVIE